MALVLACYLKLMRNQLLRDGLIWGVALWLFGYILGFIFYSVVPSAFIGWVITPFGVAVTVWVLLKYIKGDAFSYYLLLGLIWALLAVVLDYFLLVGLLKLSGYYKFDVYVYYILTLTLPLVVYWFKKKSHGIVSVSTE